MDPELALALHQDLIQRKNKDERNYHDEPTSPWPKYFRTRSETDQLSLTSAMSRP